MKPEKIPTKVREILGRYGLGGTLTHNDFEALSRTFVKTFTPRSDISSVADYVSHFPPKTAREKVIITIATAIEEAAHNARDDSTHIDVVARARAYLGQAEEEIKGMVKTEAPKPKTSRCREILGRRKPRPPITFGNQAPG